MTREPQGAEKYVYSTRYIPLAVAGHNEKIKPKQFEVFKRLERYSVS
jgi:hypothetical protein